MHARYYDSQIGVFVSPDPLNPERPFVYGFGDSVNFVDAGGLDPAWLNCLKFKPDVTEGNYNTSVTVTGECEDGYEITSGGPVGWAASFQAYLQDHGVPAPIRGRPSARNRPCAAGFDPRESCRTTPSGPSKPDCSVTPKPKECDGGGDEGKAEQATPQESPATPNPQGAPSSCNAGANHGDVNITVIGPEWWGVSFGVQSKGSISPISHFYIGPAAGTPGVSITSQTALMGSTSPGWNLSLNYATSFGEIFVKSASHGYGAFFKPDAGRYHEVGGGVGSPGVNLSLTYVSKGMGCN